jgi:peptidoglycan/xylan/chitin deacetylase (PgdA/CDA1 family)
VNWRALDEALARCRDAGRAPELWWRDDDAAAPTPPLRRLLTLSETSGVPVALAVVPLAAVPELFADSDARVLMHGTDHRNRAAPGEKKTEFAVAEADEQAIARLAAARERLARLAGHRFLPVLVPPWNRSKRTLVTRLMAAGLHGLSAYGPRAAAQAAPGVAQVNTHVDIIDWHGTRGFIGEEAALRALLKHLAAQSGEPTGVLTHHAVHDQAAWVFLERLFERTRRRGARWADAAALFPAVA